MDPQDLELCLKLVRSLQSHSDAWPFKEPVDPIKLGIPDYFTIIKRPMDFQTIEGRLTNSHYTSPDQVLVDIDLIFTNSLTYNQPGSDICKMAKALQSLTKKKFSNLKFSNGSNASVGTAHSDKTAAPSASRKKSIVSPNSSTLAKDKKRKQRDDEQEEVSDSTVSETVSTKLKVSKKSVPMTFEEKKDLGQKINILTSNQLAEVVEILRESLSLDSEKMQDVIEVDMNDLDVATLRRLEWYVNNCGKNKTDEARKKNKKTSA